MIICNKITIATRNIAIGTITPPPPPPGPLPDTYLECCSIYRLSTCTCDTYVPSRLSRRIRCFIQPSISHGICKMVVRGWGKAARWLSEAGAKLQDGCQRLGQSCKMVFRGWGKWLSEAGAKLHDGCQRLGQSCKMVVRAWGKWLSEAGANGCQRLGQSCMMHSVVSPYCRFSGCLPPIFHTCTMNQWTFECVSCTCHV